MATTLEQMEAALAKKKKIQAMEEALGRKQAMQLETPQEVQPPENIRDYILSGVSERASEFENRVGGVVEPVMALGSGMAGDIVGNLAAGAQMLNPNVPNSALPGIKEKVATSLTYQPRTERGQQTMQAVGEELAPVGEFIDEYGRYGQQVLDAGGPEWLARLAEGAPEYAMSLLAGFGLRQPATPKTKVRTKTRPTDARPSEWVDVNVKLKTPQVKASPSGRIESSVSDQGQIAGALKGGKADPRAALSKLDDAGNVVKDPTAVAASKQGWNENVIQITKSVAENPADTIKGLQMVKVARDGLKDLKYGASTRPWSVMGDSVMARYKVLKKAMLSAGAKLDDVAKKAFEGKPIDSGRVLSRLDNEISKLGGVMDDTGTFQYPAGSGLYGSKAAQELFQKVYNQAKALGQNPSGYKLHKFKQWVDDQVSMSAMKGEGLVGDSKRFIGTWRKDINKLLRKNSDAYKDINIQFSEAKGALDDLGTAFGDKRLTGPNAEEATGGIMRKWISNAPNRVPLMNAFKNAESVAIKYGGKFDDTIESQVLLANALDDLITKANPLARSTFKADINAATMTSPKHAMLEKTAQQAANYVEKLRGRTDLSALDSIEDLLRSTSK